MTVLGTKKKGTQRLQSISQMMSVRYMQKPFTFHVLRRISYDLSYPFCVFQGGRNNRATVTTWCYFSGMCFFLFVFFWGKKHPSHPLPKPLHFNNPTPPHPRPHTHAPKKKGDSSLFSFVHLFYTSLLSTVFFVVVFICFYNSRKPKRPK